MSHDFEELDYQKTPMGDLVLQKRRIVMLDGLEVFEVKLGDDWLMSSLFHAAEVALADLGIAELQEPALDVVVGGLGLGYTAVAALGEKRVRSLLVVDALETVIGWHRRGLVPLGEALTGDARCRFILGDFFALASAPETGFDPEQPARRFHAVLLDIDHSPSNFLHSRHASFYEEAGLKQLAAHLHPGGVFAMWSEEPPAEDFMQQLARAFGECRAEVVKVANPIQGGESTSTVYIARRRD